MNVNQIRENVVNTTAKYVGVKEGTAEHKKIIDRYNSQKPLPVGYRVTYTDAWCAAFVSSVVVELGYTDIIPTECSCPRMITLFQNKGIWVENENRIPDPADIIFYDWDDSSSYANNDNVGSSEHVGIVEKVSDGYITVIEGNYSNSVKRRTISVNGRYIRGYGVPNYAAKVNNATTTITKKIYLSPSSQPANTYAVGKTNEQEQCRKIAAVARDALIRCGFEVKAGMDGTMYTRVAESNNWGADAHIPIHTNAHNGKTAGFRGFYNKANSEGHKLVKAIMDTVAPLTPGSSDGVSSYPSLYEIQQSNAQCSYLELGFHDNAAEAQYIIDHTQELGEAICKGVCNHYGVKYVAQTSKPTQTTPSTSNTSVIYRVRKSWVDAASQVGAYKNLNGAKEKCDEVGAGYHVFDPSGNIVYSAKSAQTTINVGDAVKLTSDAKYNSGKNVPSWVIAKTVYVREIRSNGDAVISVLKVGAITGVVNSKYIIKNGQAVTQKPVTSSPVEFKVGDTVKLCSGATYTNGKSIPNWVFNRTLYVREVQANGAIVISTLKTGAVTGIVNKKYLTRV